MCFTTRKNARAKIAKTDIECWKVLQMLNKSPCEGYRYHRNKINPKVQIKKLAGNINIQEGYHSYKSLQFAYNTIFSYSYVRRFIIPAGTRYFENKTEYVSETIMLMQ